MTTFFNFVPSSVAPFSFSPTLDGQVHKVVVTWALFGARYYINVYALNGTLVLARSLVGSPTGVAIQSLAWALGKVTARTSAAHGYKFGTIVGITVSGALPAAYNGLVRATITGPDTFTYPVPTNPGAATAFGNASYDINLVGGYFANSSMVFRQANQQFEVSP